MPNVLRSTTVFVLAAALAAGTAAPASAGLADAGAFTLYAAVVRDDTVANARDTAGAAGDNITCDPWPVVEGRMVNPRAGIVVGEVWATVEVVAHWKCASLDTGATYDVQGTVKDYYFDGGGYSYEGGGADSRSAVAGAAAVNPFAVIQYPGGHPALNTWHFARFEGKTSTGRNIAGVSPLFYVAGV